MQFIFKLLSRLSYIKILLIILLNLFFIINTYSITMAGCFHVVGVCSGVSCGSVCCATSSECAAFTGGSSIMCASGNEIDTAIGCIPINDTNLFVGWILGWSLGIGGGIAFLLIIYASFTIMTSSGDPARLKVGKEILSSAVSGLIMLIFSVIILKFIGIDLLKLDMYGFGS